MRHAVIALAALVMTPAAMAEIDCRMPNGKVVTFQTLAACPADAAQLDAQGRVVRGPIVKAAPPPPTAPSATPKPAPDRPARTPQEPTVYDVAQTLCDVFLREHLVTQCTVDSNIFSASAIEMTAGFSPDRAIGLCDTVVRLLRAQASNADRARGSWEIRIFSPFSGNRPTAFCVL